MPTYDAFISYSHAADGRLAPALQRAIRRFARPWPLRPTLEVFRDETSLAMSPGLWPSIERALTDSKRFVLLASPEAAQSKWVQQELTWWLAQRDAQSILIVLTAGALRWSDGARDFDWEATTALPPLLKGAFPDEPHHADLTWAQNRDDLDLRNVSFKNAIRPLVAALHGKEPKDLDGDDVRAQRAQRLGLSVILVGLVSALTVTAWSWWNAEEQRRVAEDNARRALAGQLAAEARLDFDANYDRALPRAVAATRLHATPETESALAAGLDAHPHIEAFLAPADPVAESGFDSVAVSRDGRSAVTLFNLKDLSQVVFWDLEARAARHRPIDGRSDNSEAKVYAVAISGDGTLAATGADGGAVRFWSVASGDPVRDLNAGTSVRALALDGNGARAAVATDKDGPVVWDTKTGKQIAKMRDGDGFSYARLAFSADGSRLAAVAPDGTLAVWNAADGAVIERRDPPAMHRGQVVAATGFGVAFDAAGRLVTVECGSKRITLRDARAPERELVAFDAYAGKSAQCGLSGDLARVVSGTDDRMVILWATAGRRPLGETLAKEPGGFAALAFSADGRHLDAGGVTRWALKTRAPDPLSAARPGPPPFEPPQGPEFHDAIDSPDGRWAAVLDKDETGTLWDLAQRKSLGPLPAPGDAGITRAEFSRDGRLLAVGDRSGNILVWNLDARKPHTGVLAGHDKEIETTEYAQPKDPFTRIERLVFSPDGARLLSETADGTTRLWRLADGVASGTELPLDEARIDAAAFSADNSRLATAIAGRVVIWDLATLRRVSAPFGSGVKALAYAPGGDLLATGSADGTIVLWDFGTDSRQQRACAIANRNLTCEEWRRSAGERPYVAACPGRPSPVGCGAR